MGTLGDRQKLIAELSHQINSPLAAVRNALYLAMQRTEDAELLDYLALANEEIGAIAAILRRTRAVVEEGDGRKAAPEVVPVYSTQRAAA